MKRWLLIIAIVLLLLAAAPFAALRSETLTRIVLPELLLLVPGKLEATHVSGALAGPIEFAGLHWQQDERDVRVDHLTFDWSPIALWNGKLEIITLTMGKAVVSWPPGEGDGDPVDVRDLLENFDLPLDISATRLAIASLDVADIPNLQYMNIDLADVEITRDHIGIGKIDADSNGNHLSGHAGIFLSAPYQVDVNARVSADAIEVGESTHAVVGQVSIMGSLQGVDVTLEMQQPLTASLAATVDEPLDDIHWQGTLAIPATDPRRFRENLPIEQLQLDWTFDGDIEATNIRGDADVTVDGDAIALQPVLRISRNRLESRGTRLRTRRFDLEALLTGTLDWANGIEFDATVELLKARLPKNDVLAGAGRLDGSRLTAKGSTARVEFTAEGRIDDAGIRASGSTDINSGAIDVEGNWQDVRLMVADRSLVLAQGKATFTGTPRDYRFSVASDADLTDVPAGRIEVDGQGNREQVRLDIRKLDWLGGTANGSATVFIEARRVEWGLRAQRMQPGLLLDELEGVIDFAASGSSTVSPEGPHRIDIASLAGKLQGLALTGSGSLAMHGSDWSAKSLDIELGDASLSLDGDTASAAGLHASFDVPMIEQVDARFAGAVKGNASWKREAGGHSLTLKAAAEALRLPDFSTAEASIDIALNAGGHEHSSVHLIINDARVAGRGIAAARIDAEGDRNSNRVDVAVQVADGQLQLGGNGRWQDDRWSGDIDVLQVGLRNAGVWDLKQRFGVLVAEDELEIGRFCLLRLDASLCANASLRDRTWQASVDLDDADLQQFDELMPVGLDYRGGLSVHANASNREGLFMNMELALQEGQVRQPSSEGRSLPLLRWSGGQASLTLEDDTWSTTMAMELGSMGNLEGGGTVRMNDDRDDSELDLSINATLAHLGLIEALYPEINRIKGRFNADFKVQGTTSKPAVTGNAHISDGELQLARYGLLLEDVQVDLAGQGRNIQLAASAASGGGTLEARLDLGEKDGRLQSKGSLVGTAFLASDTRELVLRIAPDLALESDGRDIRITGDLHIPVASIKPRQLSGTVSVSDDQVFTDIEEDTGPDERLQVHARIHTTLGEHVVFDGFGLTANVNGALTVIREPDSPALGEGRLSLSNGRYLAYGQRLTLDRGELIYTGQPLSEPGLDIRATRNPAPDVLVGVNLRGSLRQPDFSLFSEPPMTESEQLAWLVLGRPATLNSAEQQQVDSASLALGLSSGAITSRLRDELDLEEASIQNLDNEEEASLVLGKFLSPDLYVSYGIGLFEAANTFRVRYRLSSKWTLEAVSGLESSADFLYTIER